MIGSHDFFCANSLRPLFDLSRPLRTETQAFTHDVLKELTRNSEVKDFKRMIAVVEEIGERFGRLQDGKRQTMKSKFIKLGDQAMKVDNTDLS